MENILQQPGHALRALFLKGELSASEIAQAVIQKHNAKKELGIFTHFHEQELLQQAETLDRQRAAGKTFGSLAAIPITIKDNIHIQGWSTSCASAMLGQKYTAPFDADAIIALRKQDALLVGKANMDEFAMGSHNKTSIYGCAKNPLDPSRTPGGSSGGSAAAVAAEITPLALGSDTGGSIRLPAAYCGILGYKPSYGAVSRSGLVAFGSSLDQIGPLARSVSDLITCFQAIAGLSKNDATSVAVDTTTTPVTHLTTTTIGVPTDFIDTLTPKAQLSYNNALQQLVDQGATLRPITLASLPYSVALYYVIATAEATTNLARFDGLKYGMRADSIQQSRHNGFGQEVRRRILLGSFVLSQASCEQNETFYERGMRARTAMQAEFFKAFTQCTLIALPTMTTPPPPFSEEIDTLSMYQTDLCTACANLIGAPAVSLPLTPDATGLPGALQLLAPPQEDRRLLNYLPHLCSILSPGAAQ